MLVFFPYMLCIAYITCMHICTLFPPPLPTQKLQERTAVLNKMKYSPKDKEKWCKIMTVEMMSSEDSDQGDESIIVHPLKWRSDKVTCFLHSLDNKAYEEKSPQAKRQTKKRVVSTIFSERAVPTGKYASWAVVNSFGM